MLRVRGQLMPTRAKPSDPIVILQALDARRVAYVVVGALGRVIHGSDESSTASTSSRRFARRTSAVSNSRSRTSKRASPTVNSFEPTRVSSKLVPEPAGTRGYDDLRRGSTRDRSDGASARQSPRSATSCGCSAR